jgi:glycosyltransferase involved in cell wall biosynthesis
VLESERLDDLSNLYVLHRWGSALSYDPNYPDNMRDLIYHAADGSRIYAIDNSNLDHWDKQCNILFISHDFTLTGAPIILLNIVRYMRDAGCSVVVVSPQEGPLLEVYRHERIPAIIDPHILVNPFISRHTLAPYDLVVPNTVLGWHCVHAVKSLGKPCVWLIQESEFGLRHILNEVIHAQTAFWLADAVIFPAERAVAIYRGLRRANPHLAVHYGIADIGQDHPQPLFERKSGKVYFVHVGTVEHRKGPDTLIESIKRLSSDIAAQVEVLLVGRFLFPDYADQMRKMAHSFENIHFTGEIPWKDALATMAGGDVFVCTSREETGPLVVFEALALGKPVISTRVGAMEEILRDGENAYLIDVDDVEALTDRITDLVTHPEKREALGRAARQTYEEHLTIDRYGSELRAIFDKAIEGQPIEEHWVGAG